MAGHFLFLPPYRIDAGSTVPIAILINLMILQFKAVPDSLQVTNVIAMVGAIIGNINTNFTGRRTDDELRMILP